MTLKQGQCCRIPVASMYTSFFRMRNLDVQGFSCGQFSTLVRIVLVVVTVVRVVIAAVLVIE